MEKKLIVGLIFGGKSAEHEVSIHSARNIHNVLEKADYTVRLIYITRHGRWIECQKEQLFLPDHHFIDIMEDALSKSKNPKGTLPDPTLFSGIDVIFPALHGTFGEDGTVQALFTMIGIPFVGSAILGSAIGMDKDVMKRLLHEADIPIVPFLMYQVHERQNITYEGIARQLGSPFFLKPANLGSSIGVHKITDEASFSHALDDAFLYDHKVILEQAVNAREIECAVLGNEEPTASLPGEIIPTHTFYSYEAKYLDENGARLRIPAELSATQTKQIQDLAIRTFKVLCASGLARVDFFLDKKTGKLYVNEINTLPGFTDISMYPLLWEKSGIPYPKLIKNLINLGLKRFEAEKRLKTTRNYVKS